MGAIAGAVGGMAGSGLGYSFSGAAANAGAAVTIIVIDFDRVTESNLSRIVGSRPADARGGGRLKVDVMAREVHSIDPTITFIAKTGNIAFADDARDVAAVSDFVFSATDTMEARFAFNALCHQYLVPGLQIGVQVLGGRAPGRCWPAVTTSNSRCGAEQRPSPASPSVTECCGHFTASSPRACRSAAGHRSPWSVSTRRNAPT